MIRFIKFLNIVDKFIDCLPVVSFVTNSATLLYQRAHKVHQVAHPLKTSWIDDIKIHLLSKHEVLAGLSMLPLMGNFTCLAYHLSNAIAKVFGKKIVGGPIGYLGEATRAFSWGLKKHGEEVVALYLARNPYRSEQKLIKALQYAAFKDNEKIFQIILDSRTTWSPSAIKEILHFTKSTALAKLVLDPYATTLTSQQAGELICDLADCALQNNYSLIEQLLMSYPQMDPNDVGSSLAKAASNKNSAEAFEIVHLLLSFYSQMEEKYLVAALEEASRQGSRELMELILNYSPSLVKTHIEPLLTHLTHKERYFD